jgi:hypothetical protein
LIQFEPKGFLGIIPHFHLEGYTEIKKTIARKTELAVDIFTEIRYDILVHLTVNAIFIS